jgi:general secretion pathway protein B
MSSILKALKKLEDEKSARTPDAIKIDTEILRGSSPSRFPYRNVMLMAVLFFVCGSGFTYLYVKRGTHPTANRPDAPSSQAMQNPQGTTGEIPRKSIPAEDGTAPIMQVDQPRPRVPHAKSLKHSRPTTPVVAEQPKTTGAVASPAPAPAKRMPTLRVDGIAYHFGSADSLAVVNGTTVYAGAVVEGAKVEDIGKDRIRFNYEGERFEVPLGKSN